MDTTVTITLDAELQEALRRKSREMNVEPDDAVRQLIRDFVQGRLLLANQEFAKGITVAEYLALTDDEADALWDRWFTEASQQIGDCIAEVRPDAVPPR